MTLKCGTNEIGFGPSILNYVKPTNILGNMIEEIKRWLINVSNELCSETVDTAGTICDETRKANAQFVKEFMESI